MTRELSDQRVESMLGNLLRAGVGLAGAVVLAGGIWYLLRFGGSLVDYRVFRGEPSALRSIPGILKGLGGLSCQSLIQFGLLLLIGTPVARVAFSAIAFLLQRDRVYAVISFVVLGILLFSLAGALPGSG